MDPARRHPPGQTDILILCDQAEELSRLQELLRSVGYRVRCQEGPVAALTEVQQYPPDLLVIDLFEDPKKNLAFLRALREFVPGYPGAALLVAEVEGLPQRAEAGELQLGFVLSKPFFDDQFLLVVESALRSQHLEEAYVTSQRQHEEDMALATTVQRNLLPLPPPRRPGIEVAAVYHPSHSLGGDYFDVLDLGHGGTGLFVADVVGHGVAAALFTSLLKAHLSQDRVRSQRDAPEETMAALNDTMATMFAGTGRFITAVYACFSLERDHLLVTSAGHPCPMLLPRQGPIVEFDQGGLPLGIQPGTHYPRVQIPFAAGDRLYLYTDGAFEQAWHAKGRQFGLARLRELLLQGRQAPLLEGLAAVMHAIEEWCGPEGLSDDVNILGLERTAG